MSINTCFFSPFPGVNLSTIATCPLGYYCPNVIIDQQPPQLCMPSADCQVRRLGGNTCQNNSNSVVGGTFGAQGSYEPIICPPGYYCETQSSIQECPQGFFCPTGTVEPRKCGGLSICNAGSTAQVSFTALLIMFLTDIALAGVYAYQVYVAQKLRKATWSLPTADEKKAKETLAENFKLSLDGKDMRMHFKMEELGYKLKDGKEILKGVTGRIQSGKMTAIMGPSGAGKTTFMNVLCGKVDRTSGQLFISGKEEELQKFKKIYGFVPQEDIMHRELTVRENILHSARIRSPTAWKAEKIEQHVDSIIEALNLTHVANSLIGDGITRGISGGQRKRVNIGIEVAATPLCLFLDEPTSGLDSTSSLEVMDMLEKISRIGMTIVAVIHQPRVEIFQKFDEVLMIAPGGRTAYLGPTADTRTYFENMGFQFPTGSNDADVLMDILSGKGVNSVRSYSVSELLSSWQAYYSQIPEEVETQAQKDQDLNFHNLSKDLVIHRGASWLKQFWYCHNLSLLQQYRLISGLAVEIFVAAFAGVILGGSLSGHSETYTGLFIAPLALNSPAPNLWLTVQLSLLVGLSIALAAAPAGTKIFSEELPIYWRNVASGHSPSAYYVGKTVTAVYRLGLAALHYSAILTVLAAPVIAPYYFFIGHLLMFFGVYGLSAFVSMVVRRENSTLLAVVIALFSAVFCGYGLTIKQANSWGIFFVWAIQFNMWATEANFSLNLSMYESVFDNEFANLNYEFGLNRVGFDYAMMVLIGVAWRILAYIFMIGLNRDKQR